MFDLRFINVATDDTYCMAAAKATRSLLAADVRFWRQKQTSICSWGGGVQKK